MFLGSIPECHVLPPPPTVSPWRRHWLLLEALFLHCIIFIPVNIIFSSVGKPSNIKFCFTKPNVENITLTCKANSVPPPTYTITLNGKTLTNVVEGTTTISNYKEHGIGVYSCKAENIVGKVSIVLLAAKGEIYFNLVSWIFSTMQNSTNIICKNIIKRGMLSRTRNMRSKHSAH